MDRDLKKKRAKNKMFEDDKDRIEAAATNFVKELRAGTMLLRLVQEDLGPTLATANSVMATNKTERGGFGETNTRLKKWQLVAQYYEANYDVYKKHLDIFCRNPLNKLLKNNKLVNGFRRQLKAMIDFGEALHDHLEHFGRDRSHLVNAAKLLGYITNVHNAHQDYLSKSTERIDTDNADAVQKKKDSIKAAKLKLSRLQESKIMGG